MAGKPVGGELSFECAWLKGDEVVPLEPELLGVPSSLTVTSNNASAELDALDDTKKGGSYGRRKSMPRPGRGQHSMLTRCTPT